MKYTCVQFMYLNNESRENVDMINNNCRNMMHSTIADYPSIYDPLYELNFHISTI